MSVYDRLVAWNETFMGKKSSAEPAILNSMEPELLLASITGSDLEKICFNISRKGKTKNGRLN